jgi:LmbE family N-acetylglucosaminyl deacetylase
MKKILVVAAHPDDDILGCGGTLNKLKKSGADIHVTFIAEGTTCRYDKCDALTDEMKREILVRETSAKAALKILGIGEPTFYNLPCGRLDQEPIIEINKIIEKEIKRFQPDTIFTHSHKDANSDHRRVVEAVIMATRPGAQNFVEKVYSFEVLSTTEWGFIDSFRPNVFMRLDKDDTRNKIAAFKEYFSESKTFPFPRSSKGLETLMTLRGMQCGTESAEAFEVIREIVL